MLTSRSGRRPAPPLRDPPQDPRQGKGVPPWAPPPLASHPPALGWTWGRVLWIERCRDGASRTSELSSSRGMGRPGSQQSRGVPTSPRNRSFQIRRVPPKLPARARRVGLWVHGPAAPLLLCAAPQCAPRQVGPARPTPHPLALGTGVTSPWGCRVGDTPLPGPRGKATAAVRRGPPVHRHKPPPPPAEHSRGPGSGGAVTLRKIITSPSLRPRERGNRRFLRFLDRRVRLRLPQTRQHLHPQNAGESGPRAPAMQLPWGWPPRCHAPGWWGRSGCWAEPEARRVLGGREPSILQRACGAGEVLNNLKARLPVPGERCEQQNHLE